MMAELENLVWGLIQMAVFMTALWVGFEGWDRVVRTVHRWFQDR